jgi:hypothetical protein
MPAATAIPQAARKNHIGRGPWLRITSKITAGVYKR